MPQKPFVEQFLFSVLKHRITGLIGEEALGVLREQLATSDSEELGTKVDDLLNNQFLILELGQAANRADDCFRRKCTDPELSQWATSLSLADLPTIQDYLLRSDGHVDTAVLHQLMVTVISRDWSNLDPKTVEDAASQYVACIQNSLLSLEKYALDLIGQSLFRTEQEVGALRAEIQALSKSRSVPFLAPPHPPYSLVGREDLLSKIKVSLFSRGAYSRCALIGKPGVGKTAIALSLAYDHDVRSHFPDGILWTGLGRDSRDVLSRLGKWGKALDIPAEQRANLANIKEWVEAIHAYIGMKRILLIIDDAWQTETALTFRVGGPNCAHILTSRLPDIALQFAGEGTFTVDELSEPASLVLLSRFVPDLTRNDPGAMGELLRATGGLPLSIVLMGKYLRAESSSGRQERIQQAIERLRQPGGRLELEDIQDPISSHPSLPLEGKVSVPAIIKITCDALDDTTLQAFWALSVFPPKPNTFSFEAATAVTKGSSRAIDLLYEYGLMERSGDDRFTLHQAIEEFARIHLKGDKAFENMGEYFSGMLVHYWKPYVSFDQSTLMRIDVEEENIRSILRWYRSSERWHKFIPLALGYCSYVGFISRWQEEIELGKQVGEVSDKVNDSLSKAHLYCHVLPWPMWMRGEFAEARVACQIGIEAASELEGLERPVYLALAYHNLYRLTLQECQLTEDREQVIQKLKDMKLYGERCLLYAEQAEGSTLYEMVLGLAFSDTAFTAMKLGNYPEAEIWFRKRLEMVRKANNQVQISARLFDVALSLMGQGKLEEARSALKEGQEIVKHWKRGDLDAEFLFGLARIEKEVGNSSLSEELEKQARQIWDDLGFVREPFVYILNKSENPDLL